MPDASELQALAFELWDNLHDVNMLWQAAVVLASLFAAWLVGRSLRPQMESADGVHGFGRRALSELQFPLTALILVLIGRVVLKQWQPVPMLNVVVPLLVSFAIVRVAVVMLRQAFAPSAWINTVSRLVGWVVWIGFAIYIIGFAPDLLKFLDDLDFSIGKQRISLLLILQGALSVLVTLLIAMWLGRFIEARLMRSRALDINLRVMFAKLAQALLVLAAIMITLPAVGIDVTVLSVFGGMLGVGIGFGLQKIASNYVSGFIILMDRSVSIGDLVTIDSHTGQLTKMTARYVVVRSLTGLEALIPNETIITSTVLNHTYTDPRVRVAIPIQVSYQSDLDVARGIMVAAAQNHQRVLKDPAPGALILRFADSGVDLELGVWINDPLEGTLGLRSDLYVEIWREFRKNGIEIPYPQREVRLLDGAPDK
jgi:small-conductance mechanosensitive channel